MIEDYTYSRDFSDRDEHNSLTRDVAFNRRSFGMEDTNTSPYNTGAVDVGTDNIKVRLFQGIDERALATFLRAAERATLGIDLDHTPDDVTFAQTPDEGNEMFKGGLQTALESQIIVFAVQGVSRTCTHQLVRTRKAAFHQQSQRASYMGEAPAVRIPESVWRTTPRVKHAWLDAIRAAHDAYLLAVEADVSYQDARFILPEGTETFILLEYPLREFLNVYAYRACSMFQWEISHTMRECKRVLVEAHPWIEPYVKITCENTHGAKDIESPHPFGDNAILPDAFKHTCMFQGWERVEGQCDFPWARDTNRQFRSSRYEISKKQ